MPEERINEDEQVTHTDLPDFEDTSASITADPPVTIVSEAAETTAPETILYSARFIEPSDENIFTYTPVQQPNSPYFLSPDPVYWKPVRVLDTAQLYKHLERKNSTNRLMPENISGKNVFYLIAFALAFILLLYLGMR